MVMRWFKKRSTEPKPEAPAAKTPDVDNDPDAHNRQRVADATDAEQALGIIVALNPEQDERIALYLLRRDLAQQVFNDPALAGEAALSAIERHSRNHNKAVNRAARERQKQLRGARKRRESLLQRGHELIESAQRINAGAELSDRDLTARALLEEQWQSLTAQWGEVTDSLGDAPATLPEFPDLNAQLPRAEPAADTRSALQAEEKAQQAARERAELEAQQQAALTAAEQAQAIALSAAQDRFEANRAAIDAALEAAATNTEASSPGAQRQARREQRQEIAQLLRRLQWPGDESLPEPLQALKTAQSTLSDQIKTLDAECEQEKQRLEASIVELTGLLAQGETRAAGTLHGQIRRAHPQWYGVGKAPMKALNDASHTLRRLGAWQQFATSPKRQALCDAMQQAAEHPLEPKLQAERIKELRADWQALGPVREEADRQALKAFDAAAEAAFEPCRTYYAQQAEQREQNAAARVEICRQLQTYLNDTDWRTADYQAAETILHEARKSWRQHYPVPRKQEAELSKRFEALQEDLYARLQSHWNANADAKQSLIDQAARLTQDQESGLTERIEQAKRLQSQWKTIGRVPRKRDQELWQAFRAACDTLFTERDSRSAAEHARLDSARSATQALLNDFANTLAESNAGNAQVHVLKDFRGALRSALAELPRPVQREFDGEARKLMDRYQRLLTDAAQASLCAELEQYQQWDAALASNPGQPPVDATAGLFGEGSAKPEPEALLRLAVGAEMAADLPSPEADQALRMAMKMEQLQQSLGKAGGVSGEDLIAEAKAWCALGAKDNDDVTASLRSRFFTALLCSARSP